MSNPSRQPAGVPTGGQFAPDQRAESDVDLSAPAASSSMDETHKEVWAAEQRRQNIALRDLAVLIKEAHPEATHFMLEDHSEEPGDVSSNELLAFDAAGNQFTVDEDLEDDIWNATSALQDSLMRDRDDVETTGDRRMGYTYKLDLAKAAAIQIPKSQAEQVADAKAEAASILTALEKSEADLAAAAVSAAVIDDETGDEDVVDRYAYEDLKSRVSADRAAQIRRLAALLDGLS